MALKNRYEDAFNSAQGGVHRTNGPKKNDVVIGGVNYGQNWNTEDQPLYDLYLKSLEFDNNVDLIDYINQYNSPSAQASRLRQAGLNPDLQNIDNTPASGDNVQSPSAPSGIPKSQEVANYSSMAQQFLELIPQAFQMYQSIQSGFLDLDQKALGITSSIDQLAQHEIGKQAHLDDLGQYGVLPRLDYSHYPKRLQRKIEKQASSYLDDPRRQEFARSFVYKSKLSSETPRQEYLGLLSKYGYNVNDEAFVKVLKTFNEVIADSQKKQSKYNSQYYGNKNGKSLAETENQEVVKRGKSASNDAYLDLMFKANQLIDSNNKSDKIGGYVMYLLLGLLNSRTAISK